MMFKSFRPQNDYIEAKDRNDFATMSRLQVQILKSYLLTVDRKIWLELLRKPFIRFFFILISFLAEISQSHP